MVPHIQENTYKAWIHTYLEDMVTQRHVNWVLDNSRAVMEHVKCFAFHDDVGLWFEIYTNWIKHCRSLTIHFTSLIRLKKSECSGIDLDQFLAK